MDGVGSNRAADTQPENHMSRYYFDASVIVRNAFTGCRGNFRAVCANGIVRVWDSEAAYWTACHSLTAAQCARVRRLASC